MKILAVSLVGACFDEVLKNFDIESLKQRLRKANTNTSEFTHKGKK